MDDLIDLFEEAYEVIKGQSDKTDSILTRLKLSSEYFRKIKDHWTYHHILRQNCTWVYYDEGGLEIGSTDKYGEAVERLIAYAKTLEEQNKPPRLIESLDVGDTILFNRSVGGAIYDSAGKVTNKPLSTRTVGVIIRKIFNRKTGDDFIHVKYKDLLGSEQIYEREFEKKDLVLVRKG